jgi:hypothetical protein
MFFTLVAQFIVGSIILMLLEYKNRHNFKLIRDRKLKQNVIDESLDEKVSDFLCK